MKQIPFTLDAFGPDGLLKDGYEVKYVEMDLHFVRLYKGETDYISTVLSNGAAYDYIEPENPLLTMYRRTRTADEVANEVWNSRAVGKKEGYTLTELIIRAVQAGMDEMTKP